MLAGLSFLLGQSAVAEDDNPEMEKVVVTGSYICLLYTSDAADE